MSFLFSIFGTAFRNRIFHSSSVWSKINTSQIATLRNGTKHNTNNKKSSSEPTNAKLYKYIQHICIFAYSCKHKYSWVCAICSQQNSNGCQLTVAGWHFSYRHAQISDTRFLFVLRQRHHWKQPKRRVGGEASALHLWNGEYHINKSHKLNSMNIANIFVIAICSFSSFLCAFFEKSDAICNGNVKYQFESKRYWHT